MALIRRVVSEHAGVAGTPYVSTLHFGMTSAPGVLTDAVGAFWTAMEPRRRTGHAVTVSGSIPVIEDTNGEMVDQQTGTTVQSTGAAAGEIYGTANQALALLITNGFSRGRRIQGKFFMPALVETEVDSGIPRAIYQSDFGAALDTLFNSVGGDLLVWARPIAAGHTGPDDPGRDGLSSAVTAIAVRNFLAVLRSRRD